MYYGVGPTVGGQIEHGEGVTVGSGVSVAVGGGGVSVAVGTGVSVAVGSGVLVAVGSGVSVAVGGSDVKVGGTSVVVAVGDGGGKLADGGAVVGDAPEGVSEGGTGVSEGGTGVSVAVGAGRGVGGAATSGKLLIATPQSSTAAATFTQPRWPLVCTSTLSQFAVVSRPSGSSKVPFGSDCATVRYTVPGPERRLTRATPVRQPARAVADGVASVRVA